ncbi:hypothetical protein BCR33DRAFT_783720 [Rhizoclosmatium globosum]|uniref:C2H2-type domain-containing protein n=1 Tax=Rhizoclosmatium globosum TaxID=329046 RepID=A0A1Y2CHW7_9FUNG|nr:hypothetical protein BCR33DRAFT_783720 [Rhizoclosmatium globosum]|eukprot:ORY46602.1 hypothetical protein BCR33DRAFT_783720 [Rhizoclosmatium globosum]
MNCRTVAASNGHITSNAHNAGSISSISIGNTGRISISSLIEDPDPQFMDETAATAPNSPIEPSTSTSDLQLETRSSKGNLSPAPSSSASSDTTKKTKPPIPRTRITKPYYFCPICSRGFRREIHMLQHQATHSNQLPSPSDSLPSIGTTKYECYQCGYAFGSESVLRNHMRKCIIE